MTGRTRLSQTTHLNWRVTDPGLTLTSFQRSRWARLPSFDANVTAVTPVPSEGGVIAICVFRRFLVPLCLRASYKALGKHGFPTTPISGRHVVFKAFSFDEFLIDWLEDSSALVPMLEESAPPSLPIRYEDTNLAFAEGGGEAVHLPGGCTISGTQYSQLQDFMKAPSIEDCKCSEGEVVCAIKVFKS
ncbi:uncharacterized protein [Macrobrachium rosenbergii]|uniref:uncharacterized protein isoform X1 n=1 Tax=Macrobrachium rosenbergii TaxID=79674 RepID=UPI0034D5A517